MIDTENTNSPWANDGNPFLPYGSKQYIFRKVTLSATRIYLFARVHQRQTREIGHFQNGATIIERAAILKMAALSIMVAPHLS